MSQIVKSISATQISRSNVQPLATTSSNEPSRTSSNETDFISLSHVVKSNKLQLQMNNAALLNNNRTQTTTERGNVRRKQQRNRRATTLSRSRSKRRKVTRAKSNQRRY